MASTQRRCLTLSSPRYHRNLFDSYALYSSYAVKVSRHNYLDTSQSTTTLPRRQHQRHYFSRSSLRLTQTANRSGHKSRYDAVAPRYPWWARTCLCRNDAWTMFTPSHAFRTSGSREFRVSPLAGAAAASSTRSYSLSPPPAAAAPAPSSEVGDEGDEASVEEDKDQPRLENALSSQLRHLMRHTPHPVAILTTTTLNSSPSSSSSPASTTTTVHGLTLSSLTPLSLDPNPLVTFNIRLPSSTYDTLMKSHSSVSSSSTAVATKGDSPLQPHFNIHVLSATPAAAALAKRFSRPLPQTPQSYSTISPSLSPSSSAIPSDAAMLSDADTDPNLISNKSKDADTAASGIRATLQCALRGDGLKVADHVVLVAEVLGVELVGDLGDGRGRNYPNKKQKQEEHEIEDEAVGMVYAKGRFWALAERPVGDA